MYLIIKTIQRALMQLIYQLIKVKSLENIKKLTHRKNIYYLIKRKIRLISDDKPPEAKINTN